VVSSAVFSSWPGFHPIGRPLRPARIGGVAIVLLTLAACASENLAGEQTPAQAPPPAVAAPEPVVPPPPAPVDTGPRVYRVGLLVPLAGAPQQVGRDLLAAAQMALFDLADDRFELLPRDSGANATSAVVAATQLIEADRVDLILGPLLSDAVQAVAPTARAAGVPLLAFSNDRAAASGGVYVLGFAPQEQVRRVMGFARGRGFSQFAALVPDNEYGSLMAASVAESATALGVALTNSASYPTDPADTTGRTEVVKRLADYDSRKAALARQRRELASRDDEISRRALKRLEILDTLGDVGFDALVLPAGGGAVRELAPLLAFYDVDPARVKLLGTWLWDDPTLGKEPTLVGAWFAAPPPEARSAFLDRFASLYGRQPSRLATLGYDAVALAAVLARRAAEETSSSGATDDAGRTTPYTPEALTSPNGFVGMDGIFRLLPDGRTERGLAVLEIRPAGIVAIDPAPQSFEAIVN
jgi:ABC-type branched-subunit amino acid transport system substrate-binding protein